MEKHAVFKSNNVILRRISKLVKEFANKDLHINIYYVLILVLFIIAILVVLYFARLVGMIVKYTEKDAEADKTIFYADLYHNQIVNILTTRRNLDSSNVTDVINARSGLLPIQSMCPEYRLAKRTGNDSKSVDSFSMEDVEARNTDVTAGGSWKPTNCLARHRVAIIIPYRDRWPHLIALLNTLVPTLKLQNIHFKIYVSEQYGNKTYNKGILMNAAYKQALQEQGWHCFVFHDVDLIPEDVRNMYTCPQQPRHMSPAIDEMGYELPYEYLVGGVFALRTEHFQQLNGYSNSYWGWGAEDDDMSVRLKQMGFRIDRPPLNIARYKMIKHKKRAVAAFEHRYIPLSKAKHRFHFDGLNSVKYKLISKTAEPLYTHLLIDVGPPPIGA